MVKITGCISRYDESFTIEVEDISAKRALDAFGLAYEGLFPKLVIKNSAEKIKDKKVK